MEQDGAGASQPTVPASALPLRVLLHEDWVAHGRAWGHPGLHALAVYRVGHWRLTRRGPVRLLVTVLYKLVNNLMIRNVYGTEIADEAVIGRRVCIGHHQAVQIPGFCVIGDDSLIRHGVTIGFTGTGSAREDVPRLGRGVEVGAGACLLGGITIGDGARIGPHALVLVDVPAGATAFAPPARILKASTVPGQAAQPSGAPGSTAASSTSSPLRNGGKGQ